MEDTQKADPEDDLFIGDMRRDQVYAKIEHIIRMCGEDSDEMSYFRKGEGYE
ncbi:MAG: hypothetical protein J6N53_02890 [Lachnospiraceae bacterium]|nr:hypothetical protein [Lachnospiraceae bacterium]MBO6297769.1 hypothetical protein [Lachnospiraceae bacterium]MBP3297649.1 hypothetical protein [Lachnospiraceae bacterium]